MIIKKIHKLGFENDEQLRKKNLLISYFLENFKTLKNIKQNGRKKGAI